MTPVRCLRRSSSSRTAMREPRAHRRRRRLRPASAGSIVRRGVRDRDRRDPPRLRARERRRACAVEAADVEVVDDLLDQVGDVLDERRRRARRRRPRRGRRAPPGRTRGWWRSSRRRSPRARRASRSRRRAHLLARPVGEQADDRRPARVRRPAESTPPSACSALTSRSRTRSRSSPVAIRVNVTSRSSCSGVPSRDVAGRERGDRVRLAGAGARLEHGHARPAAGRRRRTRRVTGARPPRPASSPSQSRRAQRPKRRVSSASHHAPRSSARAGSASSSSNVRTPPSTSWCSGSRSSRSNVYADSQADAPGGDRVAAGARRARVRGRRRARERRRLAHPAVEEVDAARRGGRARARGAPSGSASSGGIRAIVTRASDPAAARPTVSASNGRSGCAAVSASSRTQAASRWRGFTRA